MSGSSNPGTPPEPAATSGDLAKELRPPSPKNCRNFIRRETADAIPDIVRKFVEEAKEGSVRHFASLAKVGGFDQKPGPPPPPKRRGKSLARRLLDEVERYESAHAAHNTPPPEPADGPEAPPEEIA